MAAGRVVFIVSMLPPNEDVYVRVISTPDLITPSHEPIGGPGEILLCPVAFRTRAFLHDP